MKSPVFFLMYPFEHAYPDLEVAKAAGASGWTHWFSRLSDSDFERAIDYSYAFAPPVRNLLFPEIAEVERESTIEVWDRYAPGLPPGDASKFYHRCCRITQKHIDPRIRKFTLTFDANAGVESFELASSWVDIFLLPERISCLVIKVESIRDLDINEAARLSRHLKKIVFRTSVTVAVPTLRSTSWSGGWLQIIDDFLAPHENKEARMRRQHAVSPVGVFHVNWRMLLLAHTTALPPDSVFVTELQRETFSLATGRGPGEQQNLPSRSLIASLEKTSTLRRWENWSSLFHYGNLVTVVDDKTSTRSNEYELQAESLEFEYMPINVLALSQLSYMQTALNRVAAVSGLEDVSLAAVRELEQSFQRWSTRMWFDEVCQSPLGAPTYRLLRIQYALDEKRSRVEAEISRLVTYLLGAQAQSLEVRARRTQVFLAFIAVVGLPLSVGVTLLQPNLADLPFVRSLSPEQAWLLIAAVVAASSLLLLLISLRTRRPREF